MQEGLQTNITARHFVAFAIPSLLMWAGLIYAAMALVHALT